MNVRQLMGVLCALSFVLAGSGLDPARSETNGGKKRAGTVTSWDVRQQTEYGTQMKKGTKAKGKKGNTTSPTQFNPTPQLDIGLEVLW